MAAFVRNTNSQLTSEEAFLNSIAEATRHSFALEGIALSQEEIMAIVKEEAKKLEKPQ